MRRIIAAARAGKTILEVPVYDGSENGEKIFSTLTVIGAPIPPDQRVPTDAAAGQAALNGMTRWPVTISYFDKESKGGEQTPIYSIAFELYDNGISRALTLDYNDFVLRGEMSSLEIKEHQALRVAHDPAIACPGLDPGWQPVRALSAAQASPPSVARFRQRPLRDRDARRIDAGMLGKCHQELLVAAHIIQHADQEMALAGGDRESRPVPCRSGQESAQAVLRPGR